MHKLTSGLIVLSALASYARADAPPPGHITVELVTVNGSGCPRGTAVTVAPDNTTFFVAYSDYLAVAGAGSSPTEFRKNCQLNVLVHVPQGFSFAIAEADYTGFASLAAGATASQRANYFFTGDSQNHAIVHSFNGPMTDDWQTTDTADVATLVFSPCGVSRNLNINTELRVSNGSADPGTTNWIEMDATHASVQNIFHFAWKQCQ
jgi:hypothetical protein